jgi:hypothetical protein
VRNSELFGNNTSFGHHPAAEVCGVADTYSYQPSLSIYLGALINLSQTTLELYMNHQDGLYVSAIWKRWDFCSDKQKEAILEEFRRKFPDDHFNKKLLLQFLRERYDRE